MGVKELWGVLAPVKRHRPLADLKGETLAVDLSIWIVETMGVKQMKGVVVKPHLRNIFFRVMHLTQLGVKLAFVVEGTPPELKLQTMLKRQQGRYGFAPSSGKVKKPGRSQFQAYIRECCEMLDYMGIPYIQSAGEAEAMCALLNKEGFVDGCLTDDGDAFLYGARNVYRNFTMDKKDPHVECYSMDDIEDQLGFHREALVGMALLMGCDYNEKGVPGVGKEMASKLITELKGVSILTRFKEWSSSAFRADFDRFAGMKKEPHCNICKHLGSVRLHTQKGCQWCGSERHCFKPNYDSQCTCTWHQQERRLTGRATEIGVRKKALATAGFPDQKVIDEFLVRKDRPPSRALKWKRPKLFTLQVERLEWESAYSLEKVLPLVTLYDLRAISERGKPEGKLCLKPHSIVKARVRQGVRCLEIQWHKIDGDTVTKGEYYTTIEEYDLFEASFPHIVRTFEENQLQKKTKKKVKKVKDKENKDIDLAASQLENLKLTDVDAKLKDDCGDVSTLNLEQPGILREQNQRCSTVSAVKYDRSPNMIMKKQPKNEVLMLNESDSYGTLKSDDKKGFDSSDIRRVREFDVGCLNSDSAVENKDKDCDNSQSDVSSESDEELLPLSQRLQLKFAKASSAATSGIDSITVGPLTNREVTTAGQSNKGNMRVLDGRRRKLCQISKVQKTVSSQPSKDPESFVQKGFSRVSCSTPVCGGLSVGGLGLDNTNVDIEALPVAEYDQLNKKSFGFHGNQEGTKPERGKLNYRETRFESPALKSTLPALLVNNLDIDDHRRKNDDNDLSDVEYYSGLTESNTSLTEANPPAAIHTDNCFDSQGHKPNVSLTPNIGQSQVSCLSLDSEDEMDSVLLSFTQHVGKSSGLPKPACDSIDLAISNTSDCEVKDEQDFAMVRTDQHHDKSIVNLAVCEQEKDFIRKHPNSLKNDSAHNQSSCRINVRSDCNENVIELSDGTTGMQTVLESFPEPSAVTEDWSLKIGTDQLQVLEKGFSEETEDVISESQEVEDHTPQASDATEYFKVETNSLVSVEDGTFSFQGGCSLLNDAVREQSFDLFDSAIGDNTSSTPDQTLHRIRQDGDLSNQATNKPEVVTYRSTNNHFSMSRDNNEVKLDTSRTQDGKPYNTGCSSLRSNPAYNVSQIGCFALETSLFSNTSASDSILLAETRRPGVLIQPEVRQPDSSTLSKQSSHCEIIITKPQLVCDVPQSELQKSKNVPCVQNQTCKTKQPEKDTNRLTSTIQDQDEFDRNVNDVIEQNTSLISTGSDERTGGIALEGIQTRNSTLDRLSEESSGDRTSSPISLVERLKLKLGHSRKNDALLSITKTKPEKHQSKPANHSDVIVID